ncbi:MAG: aminotransferase class I/II-fold pyridoxal phosphate-dependent enzyme, partial [Chloroflexi bacterium]|nr:aminotransferase class I/II-fold pyridoxal phosphate-dependent enzyme [Chloroflexota bacterium]
ALFSSHLALIDPGDEVIVPEPSFVAYKPGVIFAGGQPLVVETRVEDEFQLLPERLEDAITADTKALLIGYPNNPTGAVMERGLLTKIAQVAEKHDLLIFSDEIYDRLVYGVKHTCFASLPGMRERTVLLGGFSKAYAMTGWRVGYVAAPQELMPAIAKVHQYAIMCAPTMSQIAALEALRNGEEYVQAMVKEYDQRRQVMIRGLNDIGLPCFEPRGAFYAFPSIAHTGMGGEEFSEKLLFEDKVAVVPGNAFGASGEGFIRCSYATSLTQIEEALGRMENFLKRHGKK